MLMLHASCFHHCKLSEDGHCSSWPGMKMNMLWLWPYLRCTTWKCQPWEVNCAVCLCTDCTNKDTWFHSHQNISFGERYVSDNFHFSIFFRYTIRKCWNSKQLQPMSHQNYWMEKWNYHKSYSQISIRVQVSWARARLHPVSWVMYKRMLGTWPSKLSKV